MVKVAKTIKISEKSYRELNNYAGLLRIKEKKPVSIDDALLALLSKTEKSRIDDFAGSWVMGEKESKNIKKDLRKVWGSWKIK